MPNPTDKSGPPIPSIPERPADSAIKGPPGMGDLNYLQSLLQSQNTQDLFPASSPTFVGLTLSGLTASLPVVTNASKALASVTYAAFKTSLAIVQADVAGLTTADGPTFEHLHLTTDLPVSEGGTGASTFALNGVLYGNAANAIGVTAIGAAGDILVAGASPFVPAWSAGTGTGAPVRTTLPTLAGFTLNTGTALTFSTFKGGTSVGNNLWIGGGGASSTDGAGGTYEGSRNIAIGVVAMESCTTGYYNVAVGPVALRYNTTGYSNLAVGNAALESNTEGYYNMALGAYSLYVNTTGYFNVGVGASAGRYTTAGANNATSNKSVYIGSSTRSSASGNTNEVVIGDSALGLGSNTVVLGNTDVTTTFLRGKVAIGSAITAPLAALCVDGGLNVGALDDPGDNNLQAEGNIILAINAGKFVFSKDATNYYIGSVGSVAGVMCHSWYGWTIEGAHTGGLYVNHDSNVGLGFTSQLAKLAINGGLNVGLEADPGDNNLSVAGNVGVGTVSYGTNSISVIAIKNGTVPAAHVDDQVIIYSVDSADATATLGLMLEQAVEAIGTFTASHKIKVLINGTAYWIQLDAV